MEQGTKAAGMYQSGDQSAEIAELRAENEHLRAQVEAVGALADEWEADGPHCAFWGAHTRLRMVLSSTEEQR